MSSKCEEKDGNFEASKHVTHDTNGQESETGETVYRKVTSSKKLTTCKITLPTQICFLLQNHLTFRTVFHSGKYKKTECYIQVVNAPMSYLGGGGGGGGPG
jgi:hypothetical protein